LSIGQLHDFCKLNCVDDIFISLWSSPDNEFHSDYIKKLLPNAKITFLNENNFLSSGIFEWFDLPDCRIERQYYIQNHLISSLNLLQYDIIIRYRLDIEWQGEIPYFDNSVLDLSRYVYSTFVEGHEFVPYEPCTFNDQFYICSPTFILLLYETIFGLKSNELFMLHSNSASRYTLRHPANSLKGIEGLLFEIMRYNGIMVQCIPFWYIILNKKHLSRFLNSVLSFLYNWPLVFFALPRPSRLNISYIILFAIWKINIYFNKFTSSLYFN
jgi:hypothetical protein